MAMGVGVVGLRCNTQGRSGRTTMPLDKACKEAGPERASKSKSLDRNLSWMNEYHMPPGVTNGEELAAWFELKREERSQWRQEHGMRALRNDQAPCSTFVLYPEAVVTRHMPKDEMRRLIADLLAAWSEWAGHEPDAWMVHFDEVGDDGGMHIHVFDRMLTPEGEYQAAKTMNRDTLARLHREFPKTMNRLGDWGVTAHVEGGDPTKIAGLSANDRKRLLEWQRGVEGVVAEREARVEKRKSELDARETALDERKLGLDFRETALDECATALDARERKLNAREKAIDERDRHPKTVTKIETVTEELRVEVPVYRDTPETLAELAQLRAELAKATDETKDETKDEAEGDSDGWDEVERLMDETVLMRAQIKRLEQELVLAERAKSRDVSGVPGYAADVDEDAPTIR